MKNLFRIWGLVFAMACMHGVAQADLIELRVGVGLNASDPSALNDQLQREGGSSLDLDSADNFNIDALVNIPLLPIGFGLRYEILSQDKSSVLNGISSSYDLDVKDISLLVNWRIIDTLVYVGPIISIGIPSADFKLSSASENINESLSGDNLSFSLGAEAGVKLKGFILGAEAGYKSLKIEAPSSLTFQPDINLSGFYGKVLVGITIF